MESSLDSLKKYLDMQPDQPPPPQPPVNDLFLVVLESYRAVLLAMGNSGVRACPASWFGLATRSGQPGASSLC